MPCAHFWPRSKCRQSRGLLHPAGQHHALGMHCVSKPATGSRSRRYRGHDRARELSPMRSSDAASRACMVCRTLTTSLNSGRWLASYCRHCSPSLRRQQQVRAECLHDSITITTTAVAWRDIHKTLLILPETCTPCAWVVSSTHARVWTSCKADDSHSRLQMQCSAPGELGGRPSGEGQAPVVQRDGEHDLRGRHLVPCAPPREHLPQQHPERPHIRSLQAPWKVIRGPNKQQLLSATAARLIR